MNSTAPLPPPGDRVHGSATQLRTPCGTGHMVWHQWGDTTHPPLLLLHGGSGSWTHWVRNVLPLAAAGWRVLAPDLPGSGDSAKPEGAEDADALVPWMEAGAQHLLGERPVPVVGFSFGGLTAALWARAHPQRFERLVLVGAPAISAMPQTAIPMRMWNHRADAVAREAVHRHNLRTLMLAHDASVDALALHLHDHNLQRDRLRRRKLMRGDILLRLLPHLAMPVHGIWGEHDALLRGERDQVPQALQQAPHFAGLQWVEGAGHWVQYEAADAFNSAVLRCLSAGTHGG